MNKADLIHRVRRKADFSAGQAEKAVDAVLDSIAGALKRGEEVKLTNFATFKVVATMAKKGRNPQTGAEIDIPAKRKIKITPGKALAGCA